MPVGQADLAGDAAVDDVDLEIGEFHDFQESALAQLIRGKGAAGDLVVVGDEGILQAQVLAELAGTEEVYGHAGIHEEQVAHGSTFPVIGAVGGGIGQLPQGTDGDLVAGELFCDGLADFPAADAAVDGSGAQAGDEVFIDAGGGVRGKDDITIAFVTVFMHNIDSNICIPCPKRGRHK